MYLYVNNRISLNFRVIFILSVVLISFLQACNSPLDVPANRQIKTTENPYDNPILSITPLYNELGFVFPDSSIKTTLEIQTLQDFSYPISDYHFFFGINNFNILNKSIPVILGPKDSETDKFNVEIQFNASNPGIYYDTLFVNNLVYPFAIFNAKVPFIYSNNVKIENAVPEEEITGKIIFKNMSSNTATVKSAEFSQFNNLFKINELFPFEIPRNGNKVVSFTFLSPIPGNFVTNVTFSIESVTINSLIDNVCAISVQCQ
ncbi:MAG: hypothetical protein A2X64_07270 [Ignavibacteria bacterium GWF2_33_9]|nr:MAG: hypothetical protein A2X64_07270 [Ignavibacteria bacterium GWF2_33_9]